MEDLEARGLGNRLSHVRRTEDVEAWVGSYRERQEGAKAQKGDDFEAFASDGLVDGCKLGIFRCPLHNLLAQEVAGSNKRAGRRNDRTDGGSDGARKVAKQCSRGHSERNGRNS
eukprot:9478340-Pyramimonas_sp.AAC.2